MRRPALTTVAVLATLLAWTAPVAAGATGSKPVREPSTRESSTMKNVDGHSTECAAQEADSICTETSINAYSLNPTDVLVCVYTDTYRESTGRGVVIGNESGCSEVIPASSLRIVASRDQLTATLLATQLTLYDCSQQGCPATRTVTVSASYAGGPLERFAGRGVVKDRECTVRNSESSVSANVSGTLIVDGRAMAQEGWASQTEFTINRRCR